MPGIRLDESTSVLEGLDFTPQCEHSQHYDDVAHHGGDATHLCRIIHRCPKITRGDSPFYLGCEPWVEFLNSDRKRIICGRCGERMPLTEFAIVIRKI